MFLKSFPISMSCGESIFTNEALITETWQSAVNEICKLSASYLGCAEVS
jgi:hypothetical protein